MCSIHGRKYNKRLGQVRDDALEVGILTDPICTDGTLPPPVSKIDVAILITVCCFQKFF